MCDKPDVDAKALEKLRRIGGENLIQDMYRLFVENITKQIGIARAAEGNADLDSVAGAAHAMRSSAGNLGALRLFAITTRTEHMIIEGKQVDIAKLLDEIEESFETAKRTLEEKLKQDTSNEENRDC